jgi:hypothetical protein
LVRQKAPVFAVNGFALLGFKNNELSLTGAAVTPSADTGCRSFPIGRGGRHLHRGPAALRYVATSEDTET